MWGRGRLAELAAGALEPGIGVDERLQHEQDELGDVLLGAVSAAVDPGIVDERRFELGVSGEGDSGGLAVWQLVELEGLDHVLRYLHTDSDARRLTELAIVATLWSYGEVIP